MTEVIMFTGKGGVGKTTCAAATALHLAAGGGVLAISTDATPSLAHIFEISGGHDSLVTPSLTINEVGEQEIRRMWDEKFGREVYEVFASFVDIGYEDFVTFMTSILPGLGEEFMVDYIRELSRDGRYDYIIWDTAPLGQTLALLETPSLLADHLRMGPRIYARLKVGRSRREPVLDILKRWEELSALNIDFLRHGVRFNMVTIPEALAVEQLEGVFRELSRFGLEVPRIIINNVVGSPDSEFLKIRAAQQRGYLDHIYATYSGLEIVEVPMFPQEVKGLERLRGVGEILFA